MNYKPLKISEIIHIEDCFDGSYIKEILFDNIITKEFINYIARTGELNYYPNFSRPFFRIQLGSFTNIKGVEGNKTIRVLLKNSEALEKLIKHIEYENKPLTL